MNHIMPSLFQHDQAVTSSTFSSMSYTRQSQALGLAIALLLSFGLAVAMQAQSPRNYIYLFDCTTSMNKGDQPIWKPAQEALRQTIERLAQQPNTTFSIVPFKDKSVIPNSDILTFEGKRYGSNMQLAIDSLLDREIKGPQHYTNIVSALEKGFAICNPTMENRIYLFTDGKHNCPGAGSVEACISSWCKHHPKGTRLFYVMMTKDAVDETVMRCIDSCNDAFAIKCENGFIPQIADIGSHIAASTHELDREYVISFSEPVNLPLNIDCDDPYFNVELVGEGATNHEIRMRIIPKGNPTLSELNQALPQSQRNGDYDFSSFVTSAEASYFIANPEVWITMKNIPPRELQLFGGETAALTLPEMKWHDSFLWSDASPEPRVEIDFSPIFKSPDNGSSVVFTLHETKSNPVDYTLTYNGRQLKPDEMKFTVSKHDTVSILTLQFNHDAKEGDRVFTLSPEPFGLDIINDVSAMEFPAIAVNLSYDEYWNPLETFCFWLLVIIIAVLVVWFVMLKPAKYPKIDAVGLLIVGDGLYINKRIKGCRQVVLSGRKQRQSFLSWLFTGKVLHVQNAVFTSDIRVEKSAKRSVRFYVSKPWGILPTAVVAKYGSAKLKNAGKEYKVTIS